MFDQLARVGFGNSGLHVPDEVFLFSKVPFVRNDLLRRVRLARISSRAFTSGDV
jgi:hypothetical protein